MVLTTSSGRVVPIDHVAGFLTACEADQLLVEVRDETPWAAKEVQVGGKSVALTRLICWVGDVDYDFYGAEVLATAWTPSLAALRDRLAAETRASYNSVLLNLYRDRDDQVGWHADDESSLGQTPTIASVSLGGSRTFEMRHTGSGETVAIELEHGSLVVMYGDAQSAWRHRVPKTDRDVDARINLTFRWFHPELA